MATKVEEALATATAEADSERDKRLATAKENRLIKEQCTDLENKNKVLESQQLPFAARLGITVVAAGAPSYADGRMSKDGKGDTVKLVSTGLVATGAVAAHYSGHHTAAAVLTDATLALIAADVATNAQEIGFEDQIEAAKRKAQDKDKAANSAEKPPSTTTNKG